MEDWHVKVSRVQFGLRKLPALCCLVVSQGACSQEETHSRHGMWRIDGAEVVSRQQIGVPYGALAIRGWGKNERAWSHTPNHGKRMGIWIHGAKRDEHILQGQWSRSWLFIWSPSQLETFRVAWQWKGEA